MAEPSRAQHDAAVRALALYEYGAIYPDRLDSRRIQEEAGLIATAVVNAEPAAPSEQYRDGYEDGIRAAAAAVAKVHWESEPNPVGDVEAAWAEFTHRQIREVVSDSVNSVATQLGLRPRVPYVMTPELWRELAARYGTDIVAAADLAARYFPPRDVSDPDKG